MREIGRNRITAGSVYTREFGLWRVDVGGPCGSVREFHHAGLPWVGPAMVPCDILMVRPGVGCIKTEFESTMIAVAGVTVK